MQAVTELRSPVPRPQRPALSGIAGAFAALVLLGVGLSTGCDSRAREIRSKLSDRELMLFDRGQKLSSPCWACHDFYGTQNKVGPYLSGLYGRRAGSAAFPGYSQALRESGIVWNDETLRRFLADPRSAVPGTNMVSPGIPDRADLDALVFYTKLVTR